MNFQTRSKIINNKFLEQFQIISVGACITKKNIFIVDISIAYGETNESQ